MMLMSVSGCEGLIPGTEEPDVPEVPSLEFGEDFDPNCAALSGGGSLSFSFEANGEWTADADVDWITVSPASGKGSSTIRLTVEANDEFDVRSGGVRVAMGDLSKTIKVSQLPLEPSIEFASGTDLSQRLSSDGKTLSFTFESNVEWTASVDVDWLSVSPASGGPGSSKIEVTVLPNNTLGPRSHNVVVAQSLNYYKVITIAQFAENDVPDNVIYYKSSDGKVCQPRYHVSFDPSDNQDLFGGVKCISNTYVRGQGMMTFDGPVTKLGESVFAETKMSEIVIPSSVTVIEDNAFSESDLTNITIPDNVSEMGGAVFYDCKKLKCVSLPDYYKTIGRAWFYECSVLNGLIIPDGVTSIEYAAFSQCAGIRSISIPDHVDTIEDNAFFACGIEYVDIPSKLKEIGEMVFCRAALKSVTIPENIVKLGNNAFYQAGGLERVIFESTTPPDLGDSAFQSTKAKIYVPAESLEAYKSAKGWERAGVIVGY